jgi:hypothetical protein
MVQYSNQGNKKKVAEKMAKHQALLNGINDRGALPSAQIERAERMGDPEEVTLPRMRRRTHC